MKKKVIIATILVVIIIGMCVFFQRENKLKDISSCVSEIQDTRNNQYNLQAFEKALEGKDIIAMGENARGVKEYTELKSELVKYLVSEKGFRAFIIEDCFGSGAVVNDYIVNGNGKIDEVVKSLQSPASKTEEMKELVLWMKEFNEGKENSDKVRVYGCDMQYYPLNDYTYDVMKLFIDKIYPNNKKELYEFIEDPLMTAKLDKPKSELTGNDLRDLFNKALENVTKVLDDLDTNKSVYLEQVSVAEFEWSHRYLTVTKQNIIGLLNTALNQYKIFTPKALAYQETSMYENVEWVLNYEKNFGNDKAILWAHNNSIIKTDMEKDTIGVNLKNKFGDRYYALAFDFGSGNVMKYDSDTKKVESSEVTGGSRDLFGKYFKGIKENEIFIDINQHKNDPKLEEIFNTSVLLRCEDITQSMTSVMPVTLSESFDGIIFVNSISTSTLISE